MIVPLFRDNYNGNVAGSLSADKSYTNLAALFQTDKIQIKNISTPDAVTFGLLILSGEDLADNGVYFRS